MMVGNSRAMVWELDLPTQIQLDQAPIGFWHPVSTNLQIRKSMLIIFFVSDSLSRFRKFHFQILFFCMDYEMNEVQSLGYNVFFL